MSIRNANRDDILVLLEIIRKSFRDVTVRFGITQENCPRSTAFYTKERLEEDFGKGKSYYLLEDDGHLCGCVGVERADGQVCYLQRLGVLSEYRGKGFGEVLVRHVFKEAKDTGMKRVEIGIISKDMRLKGWYEKLGFVSKGTKEFDHLPFLVEFMFKELCE